MGIAGWRKGCERCLRDGVEMDTDREREVEVMVAGDEIIGGGEDDTGIGAAGVVETEGLCSPLLLTLSPTITSSSPTWLAPSASGTAFASKALSFRANRGGKAARSAAWSSRYWSFRDM